jgi:hypothetical protein
MKIKCIIIDDEPLAINVIKNHLKEIIRSKGEVKTKKKRQNHLREIRASNKKIYNI